MRLLKKRVDCYPVSVVIVVFVVQVVCLYTLTSLWACCFVGMLMVIASLSLASFNHHHAHCRTFNAASLNYLLELILILQVGIGKYAWLLHHNLGHHRHYQNQDLSCKDHDESNWLNRKKQIMSVSAYSLHNTIMMYPRIIQVGRQYPRLLWQFFIQLTLQMGLIVMGFYWFGVRFALIVFIPSVIAILGTFWATYFHHVGLLSDNPYETCYNNLNAFYNKATFNLGFHTAHHVCPGLHWSLLPAYHKTIKDKIPGALCLNYYPLISIGMPFPIQQKISEYNHQQHTDHV